MIYVTTEIIKENIAAFKRLIKVKAKEAVDANRAKVSGRDFKVSLYLEVVQLEDTLAQAIAKGHHSECRVSYRFKLKIGKAK
jgi:hypothetical protein